MSEANAHAENSKPGGASGKPPQGATKEPSAADAAHLFVFCNSKAGMGKVDKDKVNAIVMEMSKNSPYYKHELRQAEKAGKEIDAMRAKVARLSQGELARAKQLADRAERRLEASRYYDRVCCVCDMDMFFAAVEIRDRPELRDLPIAVGGGVVCTANYVARQYGVRSAMPGFIAQRLCPQLVTVRCNFDKYTAVSREIQAIFLEYDKNMVAASLDEAYLDLTEVVKARAQEAGVAIPPTHRALLPGEKHPGDKKAGGEGTGDEADEMDQLEEEEEDEEVQEREGEGEQLPGAGEGMGTAYGHEYEGYWAIADAVVKEIRMRIFEQTRLTASAGIGSSFVLAKIAADMRKPFDQYRVTNIETFLHDLPIRKICGIGRVTERVLGEALGIQTCGQLYEQRALLFACFRPGTASWFLSRSMGLGSIRDDEDSGEKGRKGISREETFRAISEQELLLSKCRELCVALAKDLEASGLEGRTLTLKLKNTEFDVMSRSHTLGHNISSAEDMHRVAAKLLEAEMPIALRLMGVRMSKLRKTGSDKNSLDAYLHNNSTATSPGQEGQGGAVASAKPSTIRVCPLCTKPLKGLSNGQVNEHIDRCLEVANAGDAEDGGKEGEEEEGGFVRERSEEDKGKKVQATQMRDGGVPAHPWGGGGREKAVLGGTIVSCFRPPHERAKADTRPQAQKSVPQEPDRAADVQTDKEDLKAEGEQQEVPRCPVCDACLRGMNNAALNAHLDGCLGEGAAGSSAGRKRKVEEAKGRQGGGGKKKVGKTGSAQAGIAPIARFFASQQPGSSSGR